jgi:hypothetical protein
VGGHGEEGERVGEGRGEQEDLGLSAEFDSGRAVSYIDVELPVEAPVDVQAVLELAAGQQALLEHRGEEHRQRVVLAEAGHLDAHLQPRVLALARGAVVVVVVVAHVHVRRRAQRGPQPRAFDLCLHADERLGAVLQRNARAPVCAGQHVILGAHGAKVAGPFGDIEADGRRLGERRAQERQLGRRQVDESLRGRHGRACGYRADAMRWCLLVPEEMFRLRAASANRAAPLPQLDAMRDNTIVQSKCRLLDRWSGQASLCCPPPITRAAAAAIIVQCTQYSYPPPAMRV